MLFSQVEFPRRGRFDERTTGKRKTCDPLRGGTSTHDDSQDIRASLHSAQRTACLSKRHRPGSHCGTVESCTSPLEYTDEVLVLKGQLPNTGSRPVLQPASRCRASPRGCRRGSGGWRNGMGQEGRPRRGSACRPPARGAFPFSARPSEPPPRWRTAGSSGRRTLGLPHIARRAVCQDGSWFEVRRERGRTCRGADPCGRSLPGRAP